jgi:uncharacterized membrane protein YraQ (UPF0718 family)
MLVESSFLFLIGILLAGLLWYFISERYVARLLAGKGLGQVWRAALIGLPLPLCSCSVLPVATQLRRSGAGKGGVAAFLTATPETGVDSIALTYTLTDPILTVARPVTAFVTSIAAGGAEVIFGRRDSAAVSRAGDITARSCCNDNCGCGDALADSEPREESRTFSESMRYAFTNLLGDLAPYLFVGFVLAGLVAALLGGSIAELPALLRAGWGGYVGAILVGLPLYICASSSTPLAAVLLAAGFSPGMVLVFMLTGAATNVSSIVVIKEILGKIATARYLVVIVLVSVVAGILTDHIYAWFSISPVYTAASPEAGHSWWEVASAIALGLLILYWTVRDVINRGRRFFLKPAAPSN